MRPEAVESAKADAVESAKAEAVESTVDDVCPDSPGDVCPDSPGDEEDRELTADEQLEQLQMMLQAGTFHPPVDDDASARPCARASSSSSQHGRNDWDTRV